jgi:hypothetical protein
VPTISRQVEEATQRAEAEHKQAQEWQRRWRAERAAEVLARRRQARLDRLSAIFAAWKTHQQVEAFCTSMRQQAQALAPPERLAVEAKIALARQLLSPSRPFERFRSWTSPEISSQVNEPDEP